MSTSSHIICRPASVFFSHLETRRPRRGLSLGKTALAVAAVVLWQVAAAQPVRSKTPAAAAPAVSTAGTAANASPAAAQGLNTHLVVSRVVQLAGAESLSAATSVQPGDVLHYTATFSNPGTSSLRDVVASMPVPNGTQWLPTSAQPAEVWASVDGKHFAPMPLMRTQVLPSGRSVEVAVPIAEIRFLRWAPATLSAGERFATSLRVRVGSAAELSTAALSNSSSASSSASLAALSSTQLAAR